MSPRFPPPSYYNLLLRTCPVCEGALEPLFSEGDGLNSYLMGWLCLQTNKRVAMQDGQLVHFRHETRQGED